VKEATLVFIRSQEEPREKRIADVGYVNGDTLRA